MQITIVELSPLNLLAWAIACTLTIAIFLLYYQFIYKTEKRDEKRIHSAHFYPTEFISDSKISTFQFYDQKWSRLIGGALALILTSILAPVIIGIPAPLNAFACLLGVVTSLWLLDKWASNLATAERSRNVNTTYLPIHCLFPAEGEQGVLLKETDIKNEVVLSEEQAAVVVDSAIEGIQTLSIYDPKKVNLKKLRGCMVRTNEGFADNPGYYRSERQISYCDHCEKSIRKHEDTGCLGHDCRNCECPSSISANVCLLHWTYNTSFQDI